MKHSVNASIIIIAALSSSVLASTARGANREGEVWFKGATLEIIEHNLAYGLNTKSPGVHASASQVIRDLKNIFPDQDFSVLIIPLMRIVKDEDAETQVRMVAALALHELRSQRGDFTIQQLARFTANSRMKHLCGWLAYERAQHASPTGNSSPTTSD